MSVAPVAATTVLGIKERLTLEASLHLLTCTQSFYFQVDDNPSGLQAHTASPVNICLQVPREVVIHNVGQASSDVQAPGCHICGHHHLRLARSEVQESSLQQVEGRSSGGGQPIVQQL